MEDDTTATDISTHGRHDPDSRRMSNKYGELHVEGRVVVFTDGAAKDNQFARCRRAGVGAFWGHDHPFNISEALKGSEGALGTTFGNISAHKEATDATAWQTHAKANQSNSQRKIYVFRRQQRS